MASGYYRFPTIHNDNVVFVCEDDLWSVSTQGGIARRLTSNLGEVTRPSLSPDGEWLAFVGREEGESDIYVMPALGGPARRLTYLAGSICQTAGWTPDGKILFADNAGHWYLRFTHLYSVDLEGNAPTRLNYGLARNVSFGPQGGVVLGRISDEPARWKRYRGGTVGRLWIDPQGDGNFTSLIKLAGNLTSPMWISKTGGTPQGRIYFISDHEGIGNLYSCLPDGTELRRHTDHENFYVRNASSDGRRIVYHAGADLYLFDPQTDQDQQLPIAWHSPQTQRNRKFVDAEKYLESWDIAGHGQAVAISARGKVFSFANWEGAVLEHSEPVSKNGSQPAANAGIRHRLPHWLKDEERLVAVTDAGGEETFIIFHSDGITPAERLPEMDIGRPEAIAVNPFKDQLVFSNHRYELMFLDLESRELRLIDRGKARPISGFSWSPDGEWVVYSISQSLQVSGLKLWHASSGEITQLTEPVLRDVAPAFDPSGRFIYFLSYRNFDPVPDQLQFDLNFPRGMRPYLITLQKETSSPFIPRPHFHWKDKEEEEPANSSVAEKQEEPVETQPAGEAKPEGDPQPVEEGEKTNGEAGEEESEPVISIDLEGITHRVIAFPVREGLYGRIQGARHGKVIYTGFPLEGSLEHNWPDADDSANGCLLVYNFEDLKEETLVYGVSDFKVTPDGNTMIYQANKRLRVIKAGEKPDEKWNNGPCRKNGWLDLNRVKVSVSPAAEWRQMFREAWRLQRDQFWTPDMSQVDWITIHNRYLPLVELLSSRSEFSDLIWEMQGELGTSHAYEFGGDYRPGPRYSHGYLGAEFDYDPAAGAWRITRIYQGDSWDARADSPLNAPGVNVQAGDLLIAINGKRLDATFTPAASLVNLAGEEITLTIQPAAQNGSPRGSETGEKNGTNPPIRTVTVKALSSENPVRYRSWVEENRRRVHAASGGKVGYVHIPDMGPAGYAEFHRSYLAEVDRLGLIVDERYNRGGFVSQLILEKLARRRLGYDSTRWSQVPIPYPAESVAGPIVVLANEFAGSDGDIFAHGFKMLKLGLLIGKRTWGGVIGIEPRHFLTDGTLTTQPEFSAWFSDVGWGIENYGTDPDIEVDITPQDYARGYDPQLECAIEQILEQLEANPPIMPEFTDRPSRALPRLPKR